ncbi:hypothetical protein [Oricola sp.]|uniref:hypothetical protein n=1 Tax=Oricola sp. TaxID=1979950 RepID=UPI003BAC99B3
MIRFLFRLLALICFAIAVVFVVIDATRSISVSTLLITPFQESVELTAPLMLEDLRAWLSVNAPEFVSRTILESVLRWPTFALFGGLAVVFYLVGRTPRRRGLARAGR